MRFIATCILRSETKHVPFDCIPGLVHLPIYVVSNEMTIPLFVHHRHYINLWSNLASTKTLPLHPWRRKKSENQKNTHLKPCDQFCYFTSHYLAIYFYRYKINLYPLKWIVYFFSGQVNANHKNWNSVKTRECSVPPFRSPPTTRYSASLRPSSSGADCRPRSK